MALEYAFNQLSLVELLDEVRDGIIISLINVEDDGVNQMHACAFKETTGPTLLTDLTPIGCPYPPGWAPDLADKAQRSAVREMSKEPPKFRISKAQLLDILARNQFVLNGFPQVLVRLDADLIDGELVTFFRVTAYNDDRSLVLAEHRAVPFAVTAAQLNTY